MVSWTPSAARCTVEPYAGKTLTVGSGKLITLSSSDQLLRDNLSDTVGTCDLRLHYDVEVRHDLILRTQCPYYEHCRLDCRSLPFD